MNNDLYQVLGSPLFSDLDRRLARFLAREDGGASRYIGVVAALASCQLRRGQIFLDLGQAPSWDERWEATRFDWPELAVWRADLASSSAVGGPGEGRPLVLTPGGKVYLQRYWAYEKLLAEKLRASAGLEGGELSDDLVSRLDLLFPNAPEQKAAARNALSRSFSLISGGPGTGKTTTVLKILLLMLERDPELSIQLAAPTGKAAARLQESIRAGLAQVDCVASIRARLEGQQAATIHRVLGAIPGSVAFRHHAENPLAVDVVVLDEASMVDVPLMAKLAAALAPGCRLILLGDKDQLAAVEAGSVLGGIVEAAADTEEGRPGPLAGTVTLLQQNFRFGNQSAIFSLCQAVRKGDGAEALKLLRNSDGSEVKWSQLPSPGELKEKLRPVVVEKLGSVVEIRDPVAALDAFGRFQILTALRQGPYGKESLNLLVEEILAEEGFIPPGRRNFPGRPLMVTENDYALRLFNGDIGILLEDEDGVLMAYFRNEDGTVRKVAPLRLPHVEPAFAMTVHKSQGSEFDQVLILLPARDTRLLTRELIYTAISRARTQVDLWGSEDILTAAIGRNVSRGSGLGEMLRS